MLDFNDLLVLIKKAATEAVSAAKPMALTFGTVTSIAPIAIDLEQRLRLTVPQLILTKTVYDHKRPENSLKVGERVVLVQMQGGQSYLVVDRVVQP